MYDPTPWSQSERRAYAKGVEKGGELADNSALAGIAANLALLLNSLSELK